MSNYQKSSTLAFGVVKLASDSTPESEATLPITNYTLGLRLAAFSGAATSTTSGVISLTSGTLNALSALVTNGILAKTAAGTVTTRSISIGGTGLSITNADGVAGNPTITSNATNLNTVSTIVARDASGNFSAGIITAALSGNASTATKLATASTINGTSFDGSANITITANTTNTLTLGTGLTGTSFNGSAAVTAAVSYGTTAGTACQGNDSRLSDSRPANGGNSDTVDNLHASSFLRSDAGTTFSGGVLNVTTQAGSLGSNTGFVNTLQISQATANTDAFQTFHVNGDYAVHFGLDGTTNDLFVGGWSAGAVKNKIWHAGNDGSGSGLDADLLDGLDSSQFIRSDAEDTITGALTSTSTITATQFIATSNGAGTNFRIGDDAWFGDVNISNAIRLMGSQDNTKGYLIFGNGDSTALGRSGTGALTYGGYTVWHSGNAGSSSGLDADLLDGQHGSYYQDASNINAGTLAKERLPGTIDSATTGNAATATKVSGGAPVNGDADLVTGTMAGNDKFRIRIGGSAVDSGWVELATADNGNEPIYVRQYSGDFGVVTRTLTLLDASGNTIVPGNINAVAGGVSVSGNSGGIYNGNGDAFSSTVNNVKIQSWYGIGFAPSISGQTVPLGEYSHWFNTRNGDMGIRGTLTAPTFSGALSGNASTASTLQTARTINSVSFNGGANITVEPYVELDTGTAATRYLTFVDSSTAGYQRMNMDTALTYNPSTNVLGATISGNAGTASKLQTARTIALSGDVTGSVAFDGSANATITAAISDAGVLASCAAAAAGSVGSYVFAKCASGVYTLGATIAGSSLYPGSYGLTSPMWVFSTTTLSGTWRFMSGNGGGNNSWVGIWLRIS